MSNHSPLTKVEIRPYQNEDEAEVAQVNRQVKPYRPEDQADVAAMFERAHKAEHQQNPCWMSLMDTGLNDTPDNYLEFWVAELINTEGSQIVGTIGLRHFDAMVEVPVKCAVGRELTNENPVKLCRLRVLSSVRGPRVGRRLGQTVIEYAQEAGHKSMIVNTTTPQQPALQLYERVPRSGILVYWSV